MSGVFRAIGKVFTAVWKVAKIVIPVVLGVGAILLTGGAALGLTSVLGFSTSAGIGGAASSIVSGLGIGTNSLLGTVMTGAIAGAAKGAVVGALTSAVTGGDPLKGAQIGALGGGLTGGLLGGINGAPAATNVVQAGKGLGVTGPVASGPATSGLDSSLSAARPVGGPAVANPAPVAANGPAPVAAATPAPATSPGLATQPVAAPAATAPAPASAAPAATAPVASRGLFGNLWDEVKNSEFLGKTAGGLGAALLGGSDAEDAAKAGQARDAAASATAAANYQTNGGTLYAGPVGRPAPLPTPVQRFGTGGRYVYDSASRQLVYVPFNATAQ